MCSTSDDVRFKGGCAVLDRHIFISNDDARNISSTNENVRYEQGISSVQMRMCSTSKSHHQVNGALLKAIFE